MLREGEPAPAFTATGVHGGERDQYDLEATVERGGGVVLLFYPFDFSPVCTAELCSMRDAAWNDRHERLHVWGISADSAYAHRAFADRYDIGFPLLTDFRGDIAASYGAKYDWWDGHQDVPKRAVFVVSPAGEIAHAWVADDAYTQPDFHPAREAVEAIVGPLDGVSADELAVERPTESRETEL